LFVDLVVVWLVDSSLPVVVDSVVDSLLPVVGDWALDESWVDVWLPAVEDSPAVKLVEDWVVVWLVDSSLPAVGDWVGVGSLLPSVGDSALVEDCWVGGVWVVDLSVVVSLPESESVSISWCCLLRGGEASESRYLDAATLFRCDLAEGGFGVTATIDMAGLPILAFFFFCGDARDSRNKGEEILFLRVLPVGLGVTAAC
jgi:hypothetical protein